MAGTGASIWEGNVVDIVVPTLVGIVVYIVVGIVVGTLVGTIWWLIIMWEI